MFTNAADAKARTNPINIKGKVDFSSNADVIVLIEGLRFSNFADGVDVAVGEPNYRSYWIVETKAPKGYEMLVEPIEVHVKSVSTTVVTDVIKNVPKNAGFKLPLTGASGASSIIMVAGLLLLVVGTSAVVVSRRKRGQAQA